MEHSSPTLTPAAAAAASSYHLRTSVGDRLLAINGQKELFPVTHLPKILPYYIRLDSQHDV